MANAEQFTKAGDRLDWTYRIVRAAIGIAGIIWVAWSEVLGPGVKVAFQDFTGMSEVLARIEALERFTSPPEVVDWDTGSMRQIGPCGPVSCRYLMVGHRTEYGMLCGEVTSATVMLRLGNGNLVEIGYEPGFDFVKLDERRRAFEVPLDLPAFVTNEIGPFYWRSGAFYEKCPAVGEPKVRYTPWLPLSITP